MDALLPIFLGIAVAFIVFVAVLIARSARGGTLTTFDGVAPGIIPANPDAHPTVKVKAKELMPDPPPRFEPPERLMPWMAGSVLPRGIGGRDVGALLVDLAVAGYLRIDKDPAASARRKREKSDWILTRTNKPVGHLQGAARSMMMLAFPQSQPGEATGMDAVRRRGSGTAGREVHTQIRADATQALGFPPTTDHPVRSALRAQTIQFHQYLRTAEAGQIRVDEAASIFSRYLPWAIALGEAEHWAAVFRDVAQSLGDGGFTATDAAVLSSWSNDLAWFGGFGGFDTGGFDLAGLDAGALSAASFDAGSFNMGVADLGAGFGADFGAFSDSIGSFGDSISDVGSSFDSFSGDFGGGSSSSCGGSSCSSGSSCGSSCGGGGGCGSS